MGGTLHFYKKKKTLVTLHITMAIEWQTENEAKSSTASYGI